MNRRQLFRNTAALTAAAPFGPAFFHQVAAQAAGLSTPGPRLLIFGRINGISQSQGNFRLASGATAFSDGSALAPLRAFQQKLSVVSGMTYSHMKRAAFGCHLADPFVLSAQATTVTQGRWDGTGSSYYESTATASLDRFIAQRLPATPLRGIAVRDTSHKSGLLTYLSYESGPINGRPNPTPPADTPRRVWEALFGASGSGATSSTARRQMAIDRVVVGELHESYRRYGGRLAGWERQEIENHLSAVEAWRTKLAQPDPPAGQAACNVPATSETGDIRSVKNFDLVTDMLIGAFRCGLMRVATFFWTGGTFSIPADRKGAATRGGGTEEHGIGHSGNEGSRRCVDQWYVERIASVLAKLKAVPEGKGTMLDNTIVVLANRDPDHNSHSIGDLSWLIAGGDAHLAVGQSLRWPSGTERRDIPHARLLATVCTAMGVSPQGFTDAAPLRELLGKA